MSRCCNECLFGANKIVRDGRMEEVIQQCLTTNTHFECHKATIAEDHACCRGFFDRQLTLPVQLAYRLNMVEFIEEKDLGKKDWSRIKPLRFEPDGSISEPPERGQ